MILMQNAELKALSEKEHWYRAENKNKKSAGKTADFSL